MATRRFQDSDEVFDFLMGYVNVEKGQKTEFKLDRMRQLCSALDDPQDAQPCYHVAGSKGKGSVSTMLSRILEASGRRAGLYTSPHLLRWKERISLAGDEMPEEIILEAAERVLPLVEGRPADWFEGGELPTYFELTTLVGFEAFRLAGCSRTVIETGLGGRLDSTNVVASRASLITPIELEHTEWLGDTIAQIAFEKAGIIKPGKPCYLSRQKPEALEVFERVSAERGSPLRRVELLARIEAVEVGRRGTKARISLPGSPAFAEPRAYACPLVGSVQAENMALALLCAAESEPGLEPEAAALGLARASLPARFELLPLDPPVVLDGAHTPASIALALESFSALFPGPKVLLFACAHDKKHEEMARILAGSFDDILVTKPGTFKQSEPHAVHGSFAALYPRSRLVEDTTEAVIAAREAAKARGAALLVAGSFYLCSEAAKLLATETRAAGN